MADFLKGLKEALKGGKIRILPPPIPKGLVRDYSYPQIVCLRTNKVIPRIKYYL